MSAVQSIDNSSASNPRLSFRASAAPIGRPPHRPAQDRSSDHSGAVTLSAGAALEAIDTQIHRAQPTAATENSLAGIPDDAAQVPKHSALDEPSLLPESPGRLTVLLASMVELSAAADARDVPVGPRLDVLA